MRKKKSINTMMIGECLGNHMVCKYLTKCTPLSVFVNISFLFFFLSSYLLRTQFLGCFDIFMIVTLSFFPIWEKHSIFHDGKYRFLLCFLPAGNTYPNKK